MCMPWELGHQLIPSVFSQVTGAIADNLDLRQAQQPTGCTPLS